MTGLRNSGNSPLTELSFDEAIVRARAAHVKVETFHQPGNDYRTEHRCRCGAHVFATNFEQHIINAADAMVEGKELDVCPGLDLGRRFK